MASFIPCISKSRVALQDALEENEKLRKIIEDLKEENVLFKQMLDEANSFVEVIKASIIKNESKTPALVTMSLSFTLNDMII